MSHTIQQQRASFAMGKVLAFKDFSLKEQKEFISYASSLPAMIHMNGLGQAMAFYKLKGKRKDADIISTEKGVEAHKALYDLISAWLIKPEQPYYREQDVLAGIISTTKGMHDYQLAQVEVLALTSWVKKFAKAFLCEEQGESQ